ncbi:hypothetical protein [Xanthovirga aplysinae]|uniref:hypothetical protein n=1 Tax=Xanthovirga aplysinae TaxID=2529853 RepID=UPI0012BD3B6F|nr:hypothetical protein [Xanthovirga aplysinae]MTI31273.1 hypothetical protein [Xanthovirga aplysinae]
MENKIGIWLDSEKSFIVSLSKNGTNIRTIESEVENHVRSSGGVRNVSPYSHQSGFNPRKLDERRQQNLKEYFSEIIRDTQDASEIFIFGPSNAKLGLEKEMKKHKGLANKIMAVEPADQMTENQLVAKVKKFYNNH